MHWRELIGLTPTIEDFGRALLRLAHARGDTHWSFDEHRSQLKNGCDGVVNLGNMYMEYRSASRRQRRGLLQKYLSVLQQVSVEVPKLWTLARRNIYPLVRTIYGAALLEIMGRDRPNPRPGAVSWPLAGDLVIQLSYDLGDALRQVTQDELQTWGQEPQAALETALANFRALPRPKWLVLEGEVYQLTSEASYEESFFLVDAVIDVLPFGSRAAVMATNRGVLLACDGADPKSLIAMLELSEQALLERPWPMSAHVLTRKNGTWMELEIPEQARTLQQRLERLSLAITYRGQKEALDEQGSEDVFVATYSLMVPDGDPRALLSYCVWSEGVRSLLPKTDLVAFARDTHGEAQTTLLVPWESAQGVCGSYLAPTRELPVRYHVEAFPTEAEWARLLESEHR